MKKKTMRMRKSEVKKRVREVGEGLPTSNVKVRLSDEMEVLLAVQLAMK